MQGQTLGSGNRKVPKYAKEQVPVILITFLAMKETKPKSCNAETTVAESLRKNINNKLQIGCFFSLMNNIDDMNSTAQ